MSNDPNTQQQVSKLSPTIRENIERNLNQINQLGREGYQSYNRSPVAGLDSAMQQTLQQQGQLGQLGVGLLGQGAQGLQQASQMTPGSLNIEGFMNPYEDQVVDQTLSDLDRARQMAVGQTEDQALMAGAFGGSRQGVADAETNRQFADRAAAAAGQLRQQGYNTALTSGLDLARLNLLGSQSALDAGGNLFGLQQQGAQYRQDRSQAERDFDLQQFQAAQQYPRDIIAMRSAAISGTPYGGGTTTTTTGGGTNRVGSSIGGGLSGASLGGQIGGLFGESGWGAAIGGGLGVLGGMFG